MNRRTLLTSISVGAVIVAGCTGGEENDERKYEECNLQVLDYNTLPEDVKTEVDTAFDEGQYESDEELLWQQVAGPRVEWLSRRGAFYTPQVDVDNGSHVLQFDETTPQYDSTKYLSVGNVPEVPLDISITIKNSKGTVLEEGDFTIEEGSRPKVPVASEFGTYTVEVTVEDWGTATEVLALHPGHDTMRLEIDEEKENEQSFSAFIVIDPAEGEAVCPWE